MEASLLDHLHHNCLYPQDKLLRTLAEVENQRRRYEKETREAFEYGGFNFARETLSVLDNLQRAHQSIQNDESLKDNKKDKNLLMYCTGGIRCEKASAYYKHKGFQNVYQLEGGIIEYTRQVNAEGIENKFKGKNFVFDHRRAETISDEVIANCHQCGEPCDTHVNCANEACHLLFIQCESCAKKMENTCSIECKEIIQLPYERQKELRKGKHASNKIFKKGRSEKLKFKK